MMFSLEGIAAAAMGVYEAHILAKMQITSPTVLEARALYVFGEGGGRALARAFANKKDSFLMERVVGRKAMLQNSIPIDTTVGEWRAHMSVGPSRMGKVVADHIIGVGK